MKIVFFILALSSSVLAVEMNGVQIPESVKVGDKSLILNGHGTRVVSQFGIPVKVYVGGLYVEKKTDKADEIINGKQLRRIEMEFIFPVTRGQAQDSWQEGFDANCFVECDIAKTRFKKEFLTKIKGMNRKEKMSLNFYENHLEIEAPGEPVAKIEGAGFVKNILAIYFGKKITDRKLYEGFLGLAKK